MKKLILYCSICGHEIKTNSKGWSFGNNAYPINNGRCCDNCNYKIVLPRRIYDNTLKRRDKNES